MKHCLPGGSTTACLPLRSRCDKQPSHVHRAEKEGGQPKRQLIFGVMGAGLTGFHGGIRCERQRRESLHVQPSHCSLRSPLLQSPVQLHTEV